MTNKPKPSIVLAVYVCVCVCVCVSHDIYTQGENILSNDIISVSFLIRNLPKSI